MVDSVGGIGGAVCSRALAVRNRATGGAILGQMDFVLSRRVGKADVHKQYRSPDDLHCRSLYERLKDVEGWKEYIPQSLYEINEVIGDQVVEMKDDLLNACRFSLSFFSID